MTFSKNVSLEELEEAMEIFRSGRKQQERRTEDIS
jgi:hypothetical protein